MRHRWYWINTITGGLNQPTRVAVATDKMLGPALLLGVYHNQPQLASETSIEFGYVHGQPKKGTGLPDTNGVGTFIQADTLSAVQANGEPGFPPKSWLSFSVPDLAHSEKGQFDPHVWLDGFDWSRRGAVANDDGGDYQFLRQFAPFWDGAFVVSGTFIGDAGQGKVQCGFEVIEDIFNVPKEIRDAIGKIQSTDFLQFFGSFLNEVIFAQAGLITFPLWLKQEFFGHDVPDPMVNDALKLYTLFNNAF